MPESFDRVKVLVNTKTGPEYIVVVRNPTQVVIQVTSETLGLSQQFHAEYNEHNAYQSAREISIDFIKTAYKVSDLDIEELNPTPPLNAN